MNYVKNKSWWQGSLEDWRVSFQAMIHILHRALPLSHNLHAGKSKSKEITMHIHAPSPTNIKKQCSSHQPLADLFGNLTLNMNSANIKMNSWHSLEKKNHYCCLNSHLFIINSQQKEERNLMKTSNLQRKKQHRHRWGSARRQANSWEFVTIYSCIKAQNA